MKYFLTGLFLTLNFIQSAQARDIQYPLFTGKLNKQKKITINLKCENPKRTICETYIPVLVDYKTDKLLKTSDSKFSKDFMMEFPKTFDNDLKRTTQEDYSFLYYGTSLGYLSCGYLFPVGCLALPIGAAFDVIKLPAMGSYFLYKRFRRNSKTRKLKRIIDAISKGKYKRPLKLNEDETWSMIFYLDLNEGIRP